MNQYNNFNNYQHPAAPGLPIPDYLQQQHQQHHQHHPHHQAILNNGVVGIPPPPQAALAHQGHPNAMYNQQHQNIPVFNVAPGICLVPSDLQKLHTAIESLYTDRIFPNEITVKARLKLLNASNQLLQIFTAVYSSLPYYSVGKTPRSGSLVAILFRHGFEGFKGWVDATSDDDVYPQELWENFEDYLKTLCYLRSTHKRRPIPFSKGRYGMSEYLQKQNLDFLQDRSLGEICHIVELAIQKKLLMYENNMLLPAMACDSLSNAMHGRPTATCGGNHDSEFISNMDELKGIIFFLLENYPEGFNLSTLKTKIKNIFGKKLSETVFHQTKLLDLVQLPPLDQILNVVKLEGNCGYLCTQKIHNLPESMLVQTVEPKTKGNHSPNPNPKTSTSSTNPGSPFVLRVRADAMDVMMAMGS